jgi:hypothetical protein
MLSPVSVSSLTRRTSVTEEPTEFSISMVSSRVNVLSGSWKTTVSSQPYPTSGAGIAA